MATPHLSTPNFISLGSKVVLNGLYDPNPNAPKYRNLVGLTGSRCLQRSPVFSQSTPNFLERNRRVANLDAPNCNVVHSLKHFICSPKVALHPCQTSEEESTPEHSRALGPTNT